MDREEKGNELHQRTQAPAASGGLRAFALVRVRAGRTDGQPRQSAGPAAGSEQAESALQRSFGHPRDDVQRLGHQLHGRQSRHCAGKRTSCYIAVRFTADASRVVSETNESDNARLAIDLTSPTLPRYAVKAVSFHAADETGWDILGSYEPYWIFNGVGMDGTQRSTASHVFDDIDTGDTASFGPTEGCMYISCAAVPHQTAWASASSCGSPTRPTFGERCASSRPPSTRPAA